MSRLEAGQKITLRHAAYVLEKPLSTHYASYGELWVASTPDSPSAAVLKFVRQDAAEQVQQRADALREEIRFFKSLAGRPPAHVVKMLDHGEWQGLPVLVLERMDGNLGQWLNNHPAPGLGQILDWCRQIAKGLAVVHGQQKHYRDLKLSNVLCDNQGRLLKLADFGEVKPVFDEGGHSYAGTPMSMAPEQALPARITEEQGKETFVYATDHRSDFYALGLILYQLVTGSGYLQSQEAIRSLRQKEGERAALDAYGTLGGLSEAERHTFRQRLSRLHDDPDATIGPDNQSTQPAILARIEKLLRKLLARSKEQRPDRAQVIIDELDEILATLGYAGRFQDEPPLFDPPARTPWKKILAALLLLTGTVAVSGLYWWGIWQPTPVAPAPKTAELPLDDTNPVSPDLLPDEADTTGRPAPIPEAPEVVEIITPAPKPRRQIPVPESSTPEASTPVVTAKPTTAATPKIVRPAIPAAAVPEASVSHRTAAESYQERESTTGAPPPAIAQHMQTPAPPPAHSSGKKALPVHEHDTMLQKRPGHVLVDGIELPLVRVQGGHFAMGNNQGAPDERPAHEVSIEPFVMSRFPVSATLYQHYCQATGADCGNKPQVEGFPARYVSRNDAEAFIRWLNSKGYHCRLPSEAEWEYAARGTTPSLARQALALSRLDANGLGLHGLLGNQWELVSDCAHVNYRHAPTDGRSWGAEDNGQCGLAVTRGGSWFDSPDERTATNRQVIGASRRLAQVGFRLVCE